MKNCIAAHSETLKLEMTEEDTFRRPHSYSSRGISKGHRALQALISRCDSIEFGPEPSSLTVSRPMIKNKIADKRICATSSPFRLCSVSVTSSRFSSNPNQGEPLCGILLCQCGPLVQR